MSTQRQVEETAAAGGPVAYDRILVPLDGSDLASRAAPVAAELARCFGAGVAYLSVVAHDFDRAGQRDQIRDLIDDGELPAGDVEVLVDRDATTAIVQRGLAPDVLVAMSTHGRGRLAGAVLGSVAEQVVRRVGGPVVLVGPKFEPSRWTGPERLVACVDGSELSEVILPVASAWTRALGLRLDLVSVLPTVAPADFALGSEQALDVSEYSYLRRQASRLRDQGVWPEWDVLHGEDPAGPILRYAEAVPGSMVALTTHGRSGLARLGMGSVAMRIAHRSRVPLLVLRPPGLD